MIYLDNAATTFPKPQAVIDAVTNCMTSSAVNAGRGVYPLAQQADEIIANTRTRIGNLLNYSSGQVILSPSATVALNQILLGLKWNSGDTIYTTPLEHNATARILHKLAQEHGVIIKTLTLDRLTLSYDLDSLETSFFNNPPKAVVMTHVSNVCGLITPIEKIARLAKNYNAITIIDGAQGGPLLPTEEPLSLIDFYVFSGHKTFYGPFGIAGYVTNKSYPLNPLLLGGTGSHSEALDMPNELPFAHEVGSHNIVAISGLNEACKWLEEVGPAVIVQHERELFESAVDRLRDLSECKLLVNKDINQHLGTLSFVIEGYTSQEIGMILSQNFNIAVRSGLHCAPKAHEFLGTLPNGTVRASFGYFNTDDDVQSLVEAVQAIVE